MIVTAKITACTVCKIRAARPPCIASCLELHHRLLWAFACYDNHIDCRSAADCRDCWSDRILCWNRIFCEFDGLRLDQLHLVTR